MARFQRPGVCSVCGGEVWFYPAPVPDGEDLDGEQGSWAHLTMADWEVNPHDPTPAE